MQSQTKVKQPLYKRLLNSGAWSLFSVFVWELIEEGLEELIAYTITNALAIFVTKAISTLAIISATQGIKLLLKRTLKPIIKTLTYKEGNDKMSKIKSFFSWIWANKKSLLGIVSGSIMALSGAEVIDVSALPELNIGGFNITPIIYYGILLIIALIGVFGKGFESIQEFADRIAELKAEKEEKSIEKEALAEIKAEEKQANQTDAQIQAQTEKAQAEAEHKAKVAEAKARILAERQSVSIDETQQ